MPRTLKLAMSALSYRGACESEAWSKDGDQTHLDGESDERTIGYQ
jgi:hypothetical protein